MQKSHLIPTVSLLSRGPDLCGAGVGEINFQYRSIRRHVSADMTCIDQSLKPDLYWSLVEQDQ